jgi:hypothetical protein
MTSTCSSRSSIRRAGTCGAASSGCRSTPIPRRSSPANGAKQWRHADRPRRLPAGRPGSRPARTQRRLTGWEAGDPTGASSPWRSLDGVEQVPAAVRVHLPGAEPRLRLRGGRDRLDAARARARPVRLGRPLPGSRMARRRRLARAPRRRGEPSAAQSGERRDRDREQPAAGRAPGLVRRGVRHAAPRRAAARARRAPTGAPSSSSSCSRTRCRSAAALGQPGAGQPSRRCGRGTARWPHGPAVVRPARARAAAAGVRG